MILTRFSLSRFFERFYAFLFKHILPLQKSRGSKNTIFRVSWFFVSTFTDARTGVIDLQSEFQTQGLTKYKQLTMFLSPSRPFLTVCLGFSIGLPRQTDRFMHGKRPKSVDFYFTFSRFFFDVGKPL